MFSELVDIQSTFGCLFGSLVGTLGSLLLICEGLESRSEIWWFSRGTLEGPRLRGYGQAGVKPHLVGPLNRKPISPIADLRRPRTNTRLMNWQLQTQGLGKLRKPETEQHETRIHETGKHETNISFAAWWPPKGGRRIYIYIYWGNYFGALGVQFSAANGR